MGKCLLFSPRNVFGFSGEILQYDTQGKYLKEIELEKPLAFDIVFINWDTVAVTSSGCAFKVYIIDVATLQVKGVIDVRNRNWIHGATTKMNPLSVAWMTTQ